MDKSSRLSGFYQLSSEERAAIVAEWADLTPDERGALRSGLSLEQAGFMIENVIGLLALPLGIATNFCINDEDVLVPMAVEEPSIVAAVSFAARLARSGGGGRPADDGPGGRGSAALVSLPPHHGRDDAAAGGDRAGGGWHTTTAGGGGAKMGGPPTGGRGAAHRRPPARHMLRHVGQKSLHGQDIWNRERG